MRYLTLAEVVSLHEQIINASGGSHGIHDLNGLDSAVAQPQMTFGGNDLYPTLGEKATALGFSLIMNHAFVDGNKRIGQAALELFLLLNDFEINATVDEQERIIMSVAASQTSKADFTTWILVHLVPRVMP
jgi:death-on-curing protein